MRHQLRVEYEKFLRRNGMTAEPPDNPGQALLTMVSNEILGALASSGIDLPCPVYVAPYPRRSFDARTRMVDGGALILVNVGFPLLVSQFIAVLSLSVQTGTSSSDGAFDPHVPTEAFRQQEETAYHALANALVAYIDSGEPWQAKVLTVSEGWRGKLAHYHTMAVLRFVVAHEFGHVLADHLDTRSELWEPRSWQQESEADQLGALIVLNHMDQCEQLENFFVASGPFLFFAIDHLIIRVRNEILGIPHRMGNKAHPPSDERAAALRGMFVRAYGPGVLHVADSCVHWMSWREEPILAHAARLRRAD
jgi:hypothetical protein